MKNFNITITFWSFLLIIICPYWGQCQSTESPVQWTIIDRSGSMRGFFNTNQIERLNDFTGKGEAVSSHSYYFINHEKREINQTGAEEYGGNTYLKSMLDAALQANPQPAIVWLITDNQPSGMAESNSDKDIQDFYSTLRSDKVKRLSFFPLKMDFAGKLFTADNRVLAENYQGRRGLLIYALLLDENFKDAFERSVSHFETTAQAAFSDAASVKRVLIKPLERETVTARLVPLPGEKLKVENDKIVGNDFDENQVISGKFGIEIDSNLGTIKIDRATIDAKEGVFSTSDFSKPYPKASINPNKIENFTPGKSVPFHITLSLEPMQVENTLSSIWNSLSSKRGDINGDIFISISVPSTQFSPVTEFRNEFSTDKNIFSDASPATQERIYNLKGLLEQMRSADEQLIKPRINESPDGRIPVKLSVRYASGWRAFLAVIPFAVIILLLALLLLLKRNINTSKYRLTWNGEQYLVQPNFTLPLFFGHKEIKVDDKIVATLKKSFSALRVKANQGYKVDGQNRQSLNTTGSDFNIERASDGRLVDFQLKEIRTSNSNNKNKAESNGWADEDYELFDYTDTYNSDLPVKMPTFGDSENKSVQDSAKVNSNDFFD